MQYTYSALEGHHTNSNTQSRAKLSLSMMDKRSSSRPTIDVSDSLLMWCRQMNPSTYTLLKAVWAISSLQLARFPRAKLRSILGTPRLNFRGRPRNKRTLTKPTTCLKLTMNTSQRPQMNEWCPEKLKPRKSKNPPKQNHLRFCLKLRRTSVWKRK